MLQYYFSIRQFWLIKCSFYIHITTPHIHPRFGSRSFPILFVNSLLYVADVSYDTFSIIFHENDQRCHKMYCLQQL